MRGVLSVSGVIGTWAGPRSPGTAYVMAHHKIGDVGDGKMGAVGLPRGRHGRGHPGAARRGGVVRRDGAHRRRRRPQIIVRDGEARGVVLVDRRGDRRRRRHRGDAPADHVPASSSTQSELPDDFVDDIERWKSRSGTVKVNLAIDRLPEFTAAPGFDPEVHGGTIVLAPSLDDVENAFQDAVAGRPAAAAVRRHLHPVGVRPDARARGQARRCRCSRSGCRTSGRPSRTTTSSTRTPTGSSTRSSSVAPGFRDSILHRQVIGPYDMEHTYGLIGGNIFHGELSPTQLFHMRPAPGYADFRTPIREPLPGVVRDPRRRRRHRHPRAQGRRADPPRPQGVPPRPPPQPHLSRSRRRRPVRLSDAVTATGNGTDADERAGQVVAANGVA